jgi:hypothetical protein
MTKTSRLSLERILMLFMPVIRVAIQFMLALRAGRDVGLRTRTLAHREGGYAARLLSGIGGMWEEKKCRIGEEPVIR